MALSRNQLLAAVHHDPPVHDALTRLLAHCAWAEIVYHGTKRAFQEFDHAHTRASDPGLVGAAFYFAPTPKQASQFAESDSYGGTPHDAAPQVIPALVCLTRPAVVRDGIVPDGRSLSAIHPQGITIESGTAWQTELRTGGYDGVLFVLPRR